MAGYVPRLIHRIIHKLILYTLIIFGIQANSQNNKNDLQYYLNLSKTHKNSESPVFYPVNSQAINLAISQDDSLSLGHAYWDRASFLYKKGDWDSSYYYYQKSGNIYAKLGEQVYLSRILINKFLIQSQIKDYIGGEVTLMKALRVLKPLGPSQQLYLVYNHLGVLHNALDNTDLALEYHFKALEVDNSMDKKNAGTSYNNIGLIKSQLGFYADAIKYFNRGLQIKNLEDENPRLYAMLLNNLTFSKLMDNQPIHFTDFQKALEIRKEINHYSGIASSYLHLGEYFLIQENREMAICNFSNALETSRKYEIYPALQEALIHLSELQPNKSNAYLREHIELSDSLLKQERLVQNKFARIQFQTDEKIKEANELISQRNSIIVGSILSVLSISLFALFRIQRTRNKKLELEKKQQDSNEQIYQLLISAQEKLEQGKLREKKRISKELHDGILSNFFGLRLNLENSNGDRTEKGIVTREGYISQLHEIEKEIRNISHELNSGLKLKNQNFSILISDLMENHASINSHEVLYRIELDDYEMQMEAKLKINIYRILQEGLTNILKHAEATRTELIIEVISNKIHGTLIDNGIGFNPSKIKPGIGIKNIQDRINELEGNFQIQSSESGTILKITLPIK